MFENCSAYVIANDKEWQTRLSHVMRQIGFSTSYKLGSSQSVELRHPTHLPFLFIHSSTDKATISRVMGEVRADGDDNVKYMPIIMLTEERSERVVQSYLTQGCDDIILYPSTVRLMTRRLRLQVNQPHDYFETSTYFGPDRRRGETGPGHPDRREGMASFYRHIEIRRDLRGGVKILSSHTFEPQATDAQSSEPQVPEAQAATLI